MPSGRPLYHSSTIEQSDGSKELTQTGKFIIVLGKFLHGFHTLVFSRTTCEISLWLFSVSLLAKKSRKRPKTSLPHNPMKATGSGDMLRYAIPAKGNSMSAQAW